MPLSILDSSAVLAVLFGEPGKESVVSAIAAGAAMCAANLAEVATRLARDGTPAPEIRTALSDLPVDVIDVNRQLAIDVGVLYASTRQFGLSLGDRFCLSLAKRQGLPAVTADKKWREVADLTGIEVRLIR